MLLPRAASSNIMGCCVQVDDHPEKVLVAGWSTNDFMSDLLRELDHGMSALPSGSEVVFVNNHSPEDTLAPVLRLMNLEYVTVSTLDPAPS
jgi:hypothetical protein